MHDNHAAAFANSAMRLIILPTERCNYRCTYCYEDFAAGKMPAAIISSVIEFLKCRIPQLRSLEISWFGGEPLLATDVMLKIMEVAVSDCMKHNVELRSGVTTNGHLLDVSTFKELVDLKVNLFQITIDGPREIHNARRKGKHGPGDFDRIVDNIRAALKTGRDITIGLRVHLDKISAMGVDKLFREIIDVVSDPRTIVSFERIKYLGGVGVPKDILVMAKSEYLSAVDDIVRRYEDTGTRIDNVRAKIDSHVCYAALPNNFVIRSNGLLQKCTVALYDERNTVGMIGNGDITINDQYANWLAGWFSADKAMLACPAKILLAEGK